MCGYFLLILHLETCSFLLEVAMDSDVSDNVTVYLRTAV